MTLPDWLEPVRDRLPRWFIDDWAEWLADWPTPDRLLACENPYDEDNYCEFCGNGSWKLHAPWCAWAVLAQVDVVQLEVDG